MPAPGGHSASTCHCGVHSPVAEGPSPAPHFSHRTWFSVLGHPRGYPVFIKGGTGQHALAVKSQKPNSGKLFAALPGFRGLILGEVAAEAGVPVRCAPWCLVQRRWGAQSERSGPGSRRTGVRGPLVTPSGPSASLSSPLGLHFPSREMGHEGSTSQAAAEETSVRVLWCWVIVARGRGGCGGPRASWDGRRGTGCGGMPVPGRPWLNCAWILFRQI